jgi:flagellar biosynthesis/type III secretory pathway M-ring protein FliF/YscJ
MPGGSFSKKQHTMETEFVGIFQSLAYPVAVSVILFMAVWFGAKSVLADIRRREEANTKLRDQYIQFLQEAHVKLTAAIEQNSTAFNRFSQTLQKLEKQLASYKQPTATSPNP